MAYNLAGLREEVLFKLQHYERFTDEVVDLAINRAIDEVVMFGSENYAVYEINPPPDPADPSKLAFRWPLPDDLIYLKSVSFDGVPLKQLSQSQYIETTAEFSIAEGLPIYYYVLANSIINVWPRPDIKNQVKKFQIYYLQKPADLVNDEDVPVIGRIYSASIISYACYWLLRGQPVDGTYADDPRANQFLRDYENQKAEARFELHRNSTFRTRRTRY